MAKIELEASHNDVELQSGPAVKRSRFASPSRLSKDEAVASLAIDYLLTTRALGGSPPT